MNKWAPFIFFLAIVYSLQSFSQFNFALGFSANPGSEQDLTRGNAKTNDGVGIVLEPKYQIGKKSRIGISTNFVFDTSYKTGFFSYDFHFSKTAPFYAGIGIGTGTYRYISGSEKENASGIAYDFRLGLQGKVDFNIGINGIDNDSFFLAMKLAFVFGYRPKDN